jgi:hypothetical protein
MVCNYCVTYSFSMFVFNTVNKHGISVLKQNSNPNCGDNIPVHICIERQYAFPLVHCKKSSAVKLQLNWQKHVNMSCPQGFYTFKYHVRKMPKMKWHCNSNSFIPCYQVPVNKTDIKCLKYSLLKYINSLQTSHITHSGWPLPGSGRKWVSPIHCSV